MTKIVKKTIKEIIIQEQLSEIKRSLDRIEKIVGNQNWQQCQHEWTRDINSTNQMMVCKKCGAMTYMSYGSYGTA